MGPEIKTKPEGEKSPSISRLALTLAFVICAALLQPFKRAAASDGKADSSTNTSVNPGPLATPRSGSASAPDIPLIEFDSEAERQLLELANQARAQAGAPRLSLDSGMSKAARAHAAEMLAARELSHQFSGEPSLAQRLAETTSRQLDEEAENVSLDSDAGQAHQHLMLSPPHRANLLNPDYNVVGVAVIRSGNRIYVVQDFGHALPNYSLAEVKDRVAAAVDEARHHAKRADLPRRDFVNDTLPEMDNAACSMARADNLGTAPVDQIAERYSVLTYTTLHPEALPDEAVPTLGSPNLRSFSVGACFARTPTYPSGVYWVVLALD